MKYCIDPVTSRIIKKFPHRAADIAQSFDDKQIKCKTWMYNELLTLDLPTPKRVYIAGSWFGNVLTPLIRSLYSDVEIRLHDLDEEAIKIAKEYYFKDDDLVNPYLKDATDYYYDRKNAMVINASCEHMSPLNIRRGCVVVLQSNDYREVEEHINCVDSPEQLADQYRVKEVLYSGELEFEKYTRFMVIGIV